MERVPCRKQCLPPPSLPPQPRCQTNLSARRRPVVRVGEVELSRRQREAARLRHHRSRLDNNTFELAVPCGLLRYSHARTQACGQMGRSRVKFSGSVPNSFSCVRCTCKSAGRAARTPDKSFNLSAKRRHDLQHVVHSCGGRWRVSLVISPHAGTRREASSGNACMRPACQEARTGRWGRGLHAGRTSDGSEPLITALTCVGPCVKVRRGVTNVGGGKVAPLLNTVVGVIGDR